MSDDLVKRLRHGTAGDKERHAAADRIEKLEEDVGVLIAASIRLSSRIDIDTDPYVDRIEKLEAALREISSVSKVYVANGDDMAQALITLLCSHRKIALAALEGKDD